MKFIEKLKINPFRSLKKSEISLEHITLLVGDQGCGKSTILKELQRMGSGEITNDFLEIELSKEARLSGVNVYYFDSESMNPRLQSLDNFSNPNGTSKGIGLGGAIQSHFMSHGEVLREFTVNAIKKVTNNSVILLDEPESGLSIKNQFLLGENLLQAVKKKDVQFIIATHCIPLIEKIGVVYDLEKNKWTDSNEYLNQFK